MMMMPRLVGRDRRIVQLESFEPGESFPRRPIDPELLT